MLPDAALRAGLPLQRANGLHAGPIGYLTAGPAVDAFGIRPTFLVLSAAVLVVALGTTLLPSLRLLDDLPDTPPDDFAGTGSTNHAAEPSGL